MDTSSGPSLLPDQVSTKPGEVQTGQIVRDRTGQIIRSLREMIFVWRPHRKVLIIFHASDHDYRIPRGGSSPGNTREVNRKR